MLLWTLAASLHSYSLSSDRAKEIRRELFQRDLRDLVGRFDADERFVLENNTEAMIPERRALNPLLLPRPYYTGLPSGAGPVLPRQPPRNCFVYLEPTDGASPSESDRFCAYFGESRTPGRYLYLAATFADEEIVPLKVGDSKLLADAIRVQISVRGQTVTWWLALQLPPVANRSDRFELSAFRQVSDVQRDRDRKIEGWAYLQKQAKTARLHVIARLDFREFIDLQSDEDWPPSEWQSTTFSVARQDVSGAANKVRLVEYKTTGRTELSLSGLGTQIFNGYGSIKLRQVQDNETKEWQVPPPAGLQGKLEPGLFGAKMSNGDLLLPAPATTETESIPDTDLLVTVVHPWRLIERGFWQILVYLIILLFGVAFVTGYFSNSLLAPIGHWARYSEQLVALRPDADVALPYSDRNNEVGDLATAINALLKSVREQMARAQAEKEARAEEAQRKREQEIENRIENMKVVGHEIRAPLQVLMALHSDKNDKSHRPIARMLAALPHLLGGDSAVDSVGSRKLEIQVVDLAAFLHAVAQNAEHADISHVEYLGSDDGVHCRADLGALEDALTNVLVNAARHRCPNTPIKMKLLEEVDLVGVEVWNDGDKIAEENLGRIFDFGFSTAEKNDSGGHGIGLFVSRDYLRRMGGAIRVRNHDSGVVFSLMLPRASNLLE